MKPSIKPFTRLPVHPFAQSLSKGFLLQIKHRQAQPERKTNTSSGLINKTPQVGSHMIFSYMETIECEQLPTVCANVLQFRRVTANSDE